ncbi:MAG TPA: D-glucuronyl C5-epimerase family protein [Solirubrobacteraceae bacterium]
MRATLLGALLLGLSMSGLVPSASAAPAMASIPGRADPRNSHQLLVLAADGHTFLRADPYLPAPGAPPAAPATSAARQPHIGSARAVISRRSSVSAVLSSLAHSGAITPTDFQRYSSAYSSAQHLLKKLTGTRHTELAAVIANVQAIAAAGQFTPSRLPALFLTVERNRQWWNNGPLLSYGQRVGFPGSRIVWESYPGQGIEIQWLATFGEANGYYLSGNQNANLKSLLGEVIPLAAQRAGGIAWEYMFQFDGGKPPWTSGLSQGTALQALSRAWLRFKEQVYLSSAQQALGIFKTPPPAGVRVQTAAGAHYLEYTYAPSERILNGFIQAVIGLYDYTKLTGDPLGAQLFEAGDAEARVEVPHYDTGGWSLYDQHSESPLNYHELLAEFLKNLCQRTTQGAPLSLSSPTSASAGPPTTPAPSSSTPVNSAGGSTPAANASSAPKTASAVQSATPIPGDEIYCVTAEHFREDLHTPPEIELLTHTVRGASRAGVQISLSKLSSVSLRVSRGGHVVWTNRATVEGGKPKLLWVTPRKVGEYSVSVSATDLAGNSAHTTGTITLTSAHH